VWGRELPGGFDSRPPPLLKEASDQPLREGAGVGRPRKGLDRSSGDRVYHTSLSVFASRGTGQVFRPPAGGPDKSSAAVLSKERREAAMVRPIGRPMARKTVTLEDLREEFLAHCEARNLSGKTLVWYDDRTRRL
jgi:hypothetical protein